MGIHYDKALALYLACIAFNAYRPTPNRPICIESQSSLEEVYGSKESSGLARLYFDNMGVQGFIIKAPVSFPNGVSDDVAIVVFRGTESFEQELIDWARNLAFDLTEITWLPPTAPVDIKGHYGFVIGYEGVRESIEKELEDLKPSCVYVTGHSQGGALATLCALHLASRQIGGVKHVSMYSFGSPRVGNKKFTDYYGSLVVDSYSFVAIYDAITRVPPTDLDYSNMDKSPLVTVGLDPESDVTTWPYMTPAKFAWWFMTDENVIDKYLLYKPEYWPHHLDYIPALLDYNGMTDYEWTGYGNANFTSTEKLAPIFADEYPDGLFAQKTTYNRTNTFKCFVPMAISAQCVIETGGDVTFRAAEKITLKPGFHAKAGSSFHAFVNPLPCFKLRITIDGEGTIDPEPGTYTYDYDEETQVLIANEDTQVLIKAEDTPGWRFDHWSGDVPDASRTSPTITIIIDGYKSVTAHFIRIAGWYHLVTNVSPGGSVNVTPSSDYFLSGTPVTIIANPHRHYDFDRWDDDVPDASRASPTITITMDGDKEVTAYFKKQFNLTIAAETGGTTEPQPGIHVYDEGSVVPISATSKPSWKFDRWDGATGDSATTIIMDDGKTVTAYFKKRRVFNLSIGVSGGGSVSKTPPPLPPKPQPPNQGPLPPQYYEGTVVTISAISNADWQLKDWKGNASGTSSTISITMDNNKSISANFVWRGMGRPD